ncbi:hypothetical protein PR202_ga31642 [Eleusine coracana subsp. coracana]|uniref:RRM domain-containing protein n=1 Tax=Eleusine coracana subsp. coracana TaxID=191504 RepID=A0AAV5DQR6_ELECO|nr:hypothetical protein PR202_ga31642 [Eleusine coracana subsp. coracana]
MSLSHRLPSAGAVGDPYYMYAPRPLHPDPQRQGVLTLFIAGLPDDVKPREIHNLFSHRPGFDHCLLEYTGRGNQVRPLPSRSILGSCPLLLCHAKSPTSEAVAFVSFFAHQAALSAMDALNGTVFDPETGDRLHIELAKSTSRRPRGGCDAYRVIDKRANKTGGSDDHENVSDEGDHEVWEEEEDVGNDDNGGGSDEPLGTENEISSNNELSADHSSQPTNKKQNCQSPSKGGPDKSSGDIPPCSTLFIANLGHACTEEELKKILSKQPGFHLLKMRRHGGMPVAFADFTDIESSTAALKNLQGTVLSSSDSEGLLVEHNIENRHDNTLMLATCEANKLERNETRRGTAAAYSSQEPEMPSAVLDYHRAACEDTRRAAPRRATGLPSQKQDPVAPPDDSLLAPVVCAPVGHWAKAQGSLERRILRVGPDPLCPPTGSVTDP